jgi:hypothetical protein
MLKLTEWVMQLRDAALMHALEYAKMFQKFSVVKLKL